MTIESHIIEWGLQRPGWQQGVLVRLADGETFDSAAISALVDEILTGTGNAPTQQVKSIQLKPGVVAQIDLSSIEDLQGVNALVDGQQLKLESTGMTVIYGDNGSGKSGYARLIKAMVSARHRSDVLPNVFEHSAGTPTGVLRYRVAGQDRELRFPDPPPAEFLQMKFYDEHCGDEYLNRESSITYRPSALVLLDGLIRVCDDVRSDIAMRIKASEAKALDLGISPTTAAGTFLATLTATTTDAEIDTVAAPRDGLDERLAELLQEQARLAATDPPKEKKRLEALAGLARSLSADLTRATEALSSEQTAKRAALRAEASSRRSAATVAANSSFEDEPLAGVGTSTWRLLWEAARNYSSNEAYTERIYPATDSGDACVLCQQQLDDDARRRLQRFDSYMRDTTERDALAAERAFTLSVGELQDLTFATPARIAAITAIEAHDSQLSAAATALLSKLEEQRDALVLHVTSGEDCPSPLAPVTVSHQLSQMADALHERSVELDVSAFRAAVAATAAEIANLQAHHQMAQAVDRIKSEAERLRNIKALKDARTAADTSGITNKASSLTREYASQLILDHFTRETERLRLQKVTLRDLGGQKGQLDQQPSLLGATRSVAAHMVLSEGEQTALGLAGFLTEAEFDESKSALIFDDPVTSLDHVRRDKVAERLAQLAKERQVVVFTHDVAFTGDLAAAAKSEAVSLKERTIERRGAQPGICVESFPWKAKDFPSRKNHLSVELQKLKKERAGLTQDIWEERVATWAGYLSETWERSITSEVLHKVFDRATSEVRIMRFRLLVNISDDDNKDLQEGYAATSRWGRRHDKAVETNYVAPEPEDLERELARLTSWQDRVKRYG